MFEKTPVPYPEQPTLIRDTVLEQVRFARQYSLQLLESIPSADWLRIPAGAPSNLLWQAGHLAVAQYGLMLFRQRGRGEGDVDLMPGWLRKKYGKGTQPTEEASETPEQMLEVLSRIHEASLREAAAYSDAHLLEPTDMPYAVYPIKLGALLFCPLHESLHAGQIGVIRRMLGHAPLR